ncbi:unnamed protein product [Linum tenue]|uniref:Uncharacterized protein n=1 Tax=Linum tenue TaxID=586396 RepID=A0AAV0P844_9ROSI|nr:unnamed protein product [Linum tenue]
MNRGGRASQVVDLIHLQQNRFDHIVPNQLEPVVPEMMHQVLLPAREEIVDHNHTVPSPNQPVDEMAPDETRPAGDQDPVPFPLQPLRHFPRSTRHLLDQDPPGNRVGHRDPARIRGLENRGRGGGGGEGE